MSQNMSSTQEQNYPQGEDAWNRSKESRENPELHSTGHGTSSREFHTETIQQGDEKQSSGTSSNEKNDKTIANNIGAFGHTVPNHSPSTPSTHSRVIQ